MNTQNYCEIEHPLFTKDHEDMRVELPKFSKPTIPELYRDLRSAKNKAEAGAAMRRFIIWNDIPPDLWEKLEEWFPVKR